MVQAQEEGTTGYCLHGIVRKCWCVLYSVAYQRIIVCHSAAIL